MQPSDIVIVLTTWPSSAAPATLATTLVNERLAACVNVLAEMDSVYRWQGSVQTDREHQLLVKTTAARVEDLKQRLAALHPYEVPEFLVLSVAGGSDAYLAWVRNATDSAAGPEQS